MKRLLLALCLVLLLTSNPQADAPPEITSVVLAKTGSSWDGTPLPAYPQNSTPEITILRITIPPGTTLPLHKHPVINAGVLLAGELTVTTEDGKTLHLKAGDPIVEVVDKWHYGKNTGSEVAVIVVFYAGAVNVPITVKK